MSGKSEGLSVWLGECSNYIGAVTTFHRNDSNWRVSDQNRDEATPRCLMVDLAQNVGTSHALGDYSFTCSLICSHIYSPIHLFIQGGKIMVITSLPRQQLLNLQQEQVIQFLTRTLGMARWNSI